MSTDLTNVLQTLMNLFLVLFVVGSMLAMGLNLTINQIISPLKNLRFVAFALIGNFVLVPAAGWGIATVFGLDDSLATGLIIVSVVAGAPFLPKLVQMAKGEIASGVALMVLLMVTTIVYAPIVIPILVSGASVDAWAIAKPLIVLMLIPLAIGLLVRARWGNVADEIEGPAGQISNLSLAALLVLGIGLNFSQVLSLIGTGGIIAAVVFVAAAFVIGWLLASPGFENRSVMALGTAQRNLSAAMTIAAANFASDPNVLVMVIVTALILMVMLLPSAGELGRHSPDTAATPST